MNNIVVSLRIDPNSVLHISRYFVIESVSDKALIGYGMAPISHETGVSILVAYPVHQHKYCENGVVRYSTQTRL